MDKLRIDHFEDLSLPTARANILYDEVLLALAEQGQLGNTLRLWESSVYFIVLGRTGKAEEDLVGPAVRSQGVPVLRRSSGGGTVVQGPGCLNFSFILSKDLHPRLADLRASYQVILDGIIAVLKKEGIEAAFHPISDLALAGNEMKFSGNAQKRGRKFILHHGTILYDFDLPLISKLLAMPKDIPEYRKARSHEKFATNIPLELNRFKADLFQHFTPGKGIPIVGAGFKPAQEDWKTDMTPAARALLSQYLSERKPELEL